VRAAFYGLAAGAVADIPVARRSAVQRVVFGNCDRPDPLWFLILDGLGGEFRLRRFLNDDAAWQWRGPEGMPFWVDWLATLACRRGHITRVPSTEPLTRPVAPSEFKSIRGKAFGTRDTGSPSLLWRDRVANHAALESSGHWWTVMARAIRHTAPAEFKPSAVERETDASYELLRQQLSARLLLPRSPVRIELPPFPFSDADATLSSAWNDRVTSEGWLDLVSSALWPEICWPEALLRIPEERLETDEIWPVLGPTWHKKFYRALHERPLSFGQVRWRLETPVRLGETPLGSRFILGKPHHRPVIEPIRVR
jgi:hypothetical protein